jgi:hypothetical protein
MGAETVELVTRWEPCDAFAADGAGAPVCADCGWLDEEHEAEAEVRALRKGRRTRDDPPSRLAS